MTKTKNTHSGPQKEEDEFPAEGGRLYCHFQVCVASSQSTRRHILFKQTWTQDLREAPRFSAKRIIAELASSGLDVSWKTAALHCGLTI